MKLGISSYTYPWAVGLPGCLPDRPMTAEGLLAKAVSLDLALVQICDNLPLDRLSEADLNSFERLAVEFQINIEIGTRGINLDHLRTYLRLAERFRSPILRTITDTARDQPSEDEVVETLKKVMPDFERAGVCLAIENHDRFNVKTLARILERIGSRHAGICLDTANSFGALEGPEVVAEVLAPWAVNMHVKDFIVQRAANQMGFCIEGRPAGAGQLDIPGLIEGLIPSPISGTQKVKVRKYKVTACSMVLAESSTVRGYLL
jgi:sugar phosphate isomerase/epimerase